jgi:hypothetical protein
LNPRELMLPYDLLAKVRGEIEARLRELRPSVDEYERLLAAADALEAESSAAAARGTAGAVAGQAAASGATPAPDDALTTPVPSEQREAIAPQEHETSLRDASDRRRETSKIFAPPGIGTPVPATLRRERVSPTVVQQAIVAALEHGSHTVSELVVVTAMSPSDIRAGARRLLRDGKVLKTERDGKAAYALPAAVEA